LSEKLLTSHRNPRINWRIIDTTLDRTGEGLRLLEDIARFQLDDADLTRQLKNMRHELIATSPSLGRQLREARHADEDVGRDMKAEGQAGHRDLEAAISASAKRVQQSLRVLEELARTPDIDLETERYKQARFALYTIERQLISKLLRRDKTERLCGLYVVVDTASLGNLSHAEVARQTIDGGAGIIQLRDEVSSTKELLFIARELREICREKNALFIVNNHLDIALAADADGLHLGQDDLPAATARHLLPMNKLLGVSVIDTAQAEKAQADGADYVAAGAIYATGTKEDIAVIGLKRLTEIKKAVSIPVVAIGGIDSGKATTVMAAGADAVAVISAVLGADSPRQAAAQIVKRLEAG
jgi:thiamine-phosphate pyrophosphorylase